MLAEFLLRFVEFAVRAAILLGLLWLMIKLQKLDRKFDYKFSGLLGAAALASGLDMIPCVGHPLAVPVLLVCVKKVIRADYVDAFFTIAIPYALVFVVSLFLLGPLLGNLRTRVENANKMEAVTPRQEIKTEKQTASLTNPPALKTNPPVPGMAANPAKPDLARPVAATASKTNPPVRTTNQPATSAPTNLAVQPGPVKPVEVISKYFTVKGVTRNGANSAVTIQSGTKISTVFLGEAALMQTPDGPISVRFAEIGGDSVTLEINGGQAKFPIP
jgi:hypothetical protein